MARILIPDVTSFVRAQRKKRDPNLPSLLRANNRMEPSTVVQVLKAAEAVAESPVTVGVIEGGRKLFESAARARAGLPDTEGMVMEVGAEALPIEYTAPSPEDRMPMAQPAPASARRGPEPAPKSMAKEALKELDEESRMTALSAAKTIRGSEDPETAARAVLDAIKGPKYNIALTVAAILREAGTPVPTALSGYQMKQDIGKEAPMPQGEVKGDVGVVDVPASPVPVKEAAPVLPRNTGASAPSPAQQVLTALTEKRPGKESIPSQLEGLVGTLRDQAARRVPESVEPQAAAKEPEKVLEIPTDLPKVDTEIPQRRKDEVLPALESLTDMASILDFARRADTPQKQALALRAVAGIRRRPRNAFEALGIMERDPSEQVALARQVATLFPGDTDAAMLKARAGLEREATNRIKAITDRYKTVGQIKKFEAESKRALADAEKKKSEAKTIEGKRKAELEKLSAEVDYMTARGASTVGQAIAALVRARKYWVPGRSARPKPIPNYIKEGLKGLDRELSDQRSTRRSLVTKLGSLDRVPDPGAEPRSFAKDETGTPMNIPANKAWFDWKKRKEKFDAAADARSNVTRMIERSRDNIETLEAERRDYVDQLKEIVGGKQPTRRKRKASSAPSAEEAADILRGN